MNLVPTIATLSLAAATWWSSLWFTPDQQGDRLMKRGEYAAAAKAYRDPMRQGVAWFRAGEFEKADQSFARSASPEAEYNRGNCLIMLGKYDDAVSRYDRALELRPDWPDAMANRDLAIARAKLVEQKGGDMGDQKIGADEITFDKPNNNEGQDTDLTGDKPATDEALQALWLRRVQTSPADFLKSKFAYQLATDPSE
ncbi:MAG: tetratricopeptide repeat protein [Verrucomicrobiota bacterium]